MRIAGENFEERERGLPQIAAGSLVRALEVHLARNDSGANCGRYSSAS